MPQLSLIEGSQVGHHFVVEYWADPLKPNDHPSVLVTIKNHRGVDIKNLFTRVPNEVIFEMVADIAAATWQAWLFGEGTDIDKAFGRSVGYWAQEAHERCVGMEVGRGR